MGYDYGEDLKKLILYGLIGGTAGFLIAFCMTAGDHLDLTTRLTLLLVFTFAFTGFPYTYKKLGDLFGRYFAFSIVGMFFYWGFKIMVAMIAGWVVYPIVLVYTVIQYLRMRNAERQYFNEI